MTWSQNAWKAIETIFTAITEHPFITELISGKLPREKFLFYLSQDSLYLNDFGRVLSGIASKIPSEDDSLTLMRFASEAISVERELHQSFLKDIPFTHKPSPSCLLYTSFMHRQLSFRPLEIAMASLLPCFWIYKEVGDYILAKAKTEANPYQSWIDTYGGEEYASSVTLAVNLTDKLAQGVTESLKEEMTQSFVLTSKMEWMFWDSAYKLEKWPV